MHTTPKAIHGALNKNRTCAGVDRGALQAADVLHGMMEVGVESDGE